ncbi:MAG: glycosyltransferase family 2 protein [Bacteroidota bacterium]
MSLYLERYAFKSKLIKIEPTQNLGLIVTLPAFKETDLISSLESLKNCHLPEASVEVIVVINQAENAGPEITEINQHCYEQAEKWSECNSTNQLKYYILFCRDLPAKHAGVGLARKIAMDEAVRRFERVNNPRGVIACFDGDSICNPNYLEKLYTHFQDNPKTPACSIYFEHPLEGALDSGIYTAIAEYELFLRYYVQGLHYAGFPWAFHTIGSSMAVRSDAYQKQGGMNRRKAGEDFYFLQRMFRLGGFTELNSTKITPSPRISDRVPFGTGKAVADWQLKPGITTYHPQVFADMKLFMESVPEFLCSKPNSAISKLPESIRLFLTESNFEHELERIKRSSTSAEVFRKSFFYWFDGFRALKYVHFSRDRFYSNLPVEKAAFLLLEMRGFKVKAESTKQLLAYYRKLDRSRLTRD